MTTLRARIFGLFLALLMVVLAATLVTTNRASYAHTRRRVERELEQGSRIFVETLRGRQRALASEAETLAKEDALRRAVFADAEHPESLRVALDNHRRRTEAGWALLVGLDGVILADTLRPEAIGSPFVAIDPAAATAADERLPLARIEGRVFQFAIAAYYVPVSAPQPSLWLVLGREIDDSLAVELLGLTGLEVGLSFDDGAPTLVGASLDPRRRAALAARPLPAESELTLLGQRYFAASTEVRARAGGRLVGVQLVSAREALLDFRELTTQVVAITGISALLAALGALLIARGVTRPLNQLGEAARRIAAGDYGAALPAAGTLEVAALSADLQKMGSEIRSREQAIEHLAYHDELTGLPNRNRFRRELELAIRVAAGVRGRLAVAVLDLDRFQDINDTLGHHVGDRLLLEVGRRLESLAADGTDLAIARLGGDEFAVLFRDGGVARVRDEVARLRALVAESIRTEDLDVEIQASAGIAFYPDHGSDPTILLKHAEVAMYVAKRHRSGAAFYESKDDRHSIHRLSLMIDLKRAVETGELRLEYQPKVGLVDGSIRQAEALVRWDHPVHGAVPPSEFVPIAEQTGAIRHLTRWVIASALDQLAAWREDGIDLLLAVNVSPLDLYDPELPRWLATELERTGVKGSALVLEVTESSIMDDPVTARRTLDDLTRLGMTVSIDDFGTGYSSLAQLQRLPVRELKIDRSFVASLAEARDSKLIVRFMVELGHSLGLQVVAEGVESAETAALLREIGCDYAQGYHFGRPVGPDELGARVRSAALGAGIELAK